MLQQAVRSLTREEFAAAAYVKVRSGDTLEKMDERLSRLHAKGVRYVFVDEVTLMEDFIDFTRHSSRSGSIRVCGESTTSTCSTGRGSRTAATPSPTARRGLCSATRTASSAPSRSGGSGGARILAKEVVVQDGIAYVGDGTGKCFAVKIP